ncbi:hypothetical protein DdX_17635 [Ditylenchus destructor]|uniref:Uncharacterized protein n=1 Tax=Ditylenchus destructor TaxID=166010 RepID=A0AAD4MNR6_9BILA|nr:hypothetical protein DdX_17635 [Ditylenchus destructor]
MPPSQQPNSPTTKTNEGTNTKTVPKPTKNAGRTLNSVVIKPLKDEQPSTAQSLNRPRRRPTPMPTSIDIKRPRINPPRTPTPEIEIQDDQIESNSSIPPTLCHNLIPKESEEAHKHSQDLTRETTNRSNNSRSKNHQSSICPEAINHFLSRGRTRSKSQSREPRQSRQRRHSPGINHKRRQNREHRPDTPRTSRHDQPRRSSQDRNHTMPAQRGIFIPEDKAQELIRLARRTLDILDAYR